MKKRLLALCLALMTAFALLSGCGRFSSGESESSQETTQASEDAEETLTDIPDEAYEDVVYYLTDGAIAADDVVYTVNGVDMTAAYYLYWIAYEAYLYSQTYYNSYYVYPEITQEFSNGSTMVDLVTTAAYNYAVSYTVVYSQAAADGVELSGDYLESYETYYEESKQEMGEELWEAAVYYGTISEDDYSDSEKEAWIESLGEAQMMLYLMYYSTTADGIDTLYYYNNYYTQYRDYLCLDGGEYEASDSEIEAYIEEYDLYACRYVLVSGEDEAEECYETLSSLSGDALDEAIAEYAADNLDGNTTGEVCFASSAELVEGFADLVGALEIGEIAVSDDMDGYYYIVIRDEVTKDSIITELEYSVEVSVAEVIFEDLIDEWMEEAQVTDTGVLDAFDIYTFYEKLEELRDVIDSES